MEYLNNPAKRVLNLVNQVKSKNDSVTMSVAWGEVFGLDINVVKKDPHEVYSKLMLVRKEIELLESLMQQTSFSRNLYQPYLDRVKSTISVNNLSATWTSYKNNLSTDTILALRYCSEILEDEDAVDKDELESILNSVRALKEEIETSSLSPGMHDFLISQLDIIESAIQSYPITGGSALKKAFSQGFTDLASRVDDISESTDDDHDEASKVATVWGNLKTASKGIAETDRMANALIGLYDKGQNVAEPLLSLFSGS
ncbi:hypothetical protein [Aliivibrio sifiae]|uniref:Uncharacterized protein n=1 Tax=Aliivibrio sifiae TaxID=566293 RepID=A0A2S7X805_9GAMM|nr:hypothetical protein [Aliivibrio sifiae]PQJ87479.1 hypothetical protein BTO23_15330 [Aliivibrio sifiae]GLR77158.1 hypothetical protein GCM10007855_40330 [Aliivibrio sifiae]